MITDGDREKEQCKTQVWDGFHHHQCSRTAWKDGYCKQHHPETIKTRDLARKERYEAKRKMSSWYMLEQAQKRIVELEAREKACSDCPKVKELLRKFYKCKSIEQVWIIAGKALKSAKESGL